VAKEKLIMIDKRKMLILIGFILCIALMVLASSYDLSISQAVYNKNNLFSKIFETIGELPLYALFIFSFLVFAVTFSKSANIWKLILSSACIILSYVILIAFIDRMIGDFSLLYLSAFFSLILVGLGWFLLNKLSDDVIKKLYAFSIFSFSFCLITFLLNQGIKEIWGRSRFYLMAESNDYSLFTPWWQICGFTGSHSFYSGHTTSSMAILLLLPLARIFKMQHNKYILLHYIVFAFVILVAISRVVRGAHFLSDVTFAIIINSIVYLILYNRFGKKLISKYEM